MTAMSSKHPPITPDAAPFDDDTPEWTDEMFARARLEADTLPPVLREALARSRGRPKLETAKIAVKLRLDPEVVDGFKAGGPGWQTRINATLRDALAKQGQ
jgi:uncharacterized protein (DUF4415 family)